MKKLPSIFNDVIGPVMRGPSSSHTAASWRVGKMAIQLLSEGLHSATITFDPEGQWATNYREQGTVLGMHGGLLDINMSDDQIKRIEEIATIRGISIEYKIASFENNHPNSMLVDLQDRKGNQHLILAASLGGGSFEIQSIDGVKASLRGDLQSVVVWSEQDITLSLSNLRPASSNISSGTYQGQYVYIMTNEKKLDAFAISKIASLDKVSTVKVIEPIMPIASGRESQLPFNSISELVEYASVEDLSLGELGLYYEKCKSGLSEADIKDKMNALIDIIEGSIAKGLAGTEYADRVLPRQSHLIQKAERAKRILQNSIINTIVENVAAIMESKSALEVIVANPTAGSCGTVGAAIKAVADEQGISREEKVMAYFAAGLVGAYFAMGPGFSAEEHGCQVECGASAGMAAAGIVEIFGGSAEQALGAASMAIQNMIGLVCDPIADRVEAPCLGKNTSAAVNALSSATMAIAGFAHLIPLDQVLETVERVSADMPSCVKCTGLGGLAATPAAKAIKEEMKKKTLESRIKTEN